MAVLTAMKVRDLGLEVTANLVGVNASDKFANFSMRSFIFIKNEGGSVDNVGFDGNPDVSVSVPVTNQRLIGPFDRDFEDESGFVNLTHSNTVAVDGILCYLPEEN